MNRWIERDKQRRNLVNKFEKKRKILKAIMYNTTLPFNERFRAQVELSRLPKDSSITRIKNRCVITGRARSVYSKFKLSRIAFRNLASQGKLPGVTKSSW